MQSSFKMAFLLLVAFGLVAFIQQNNTAIIKGKLKRVDMFLSGTHYDYLYDAFGRIAIVQYPYGKKKNFTYSGNYVFMETIDPTDETYYDTLVMKSYGLIDSALSAKSFWSVDYDLNGNISSEKYTPLKGKKRKPGKTKFTYSFEYYSQKWDSASFDLLACGCEEKDGRNLLKTKVGIDAKGDTTLFFTYKYYFDKEGILKARTEYYRTGQLYDSIGFSYY
jgi:hypothetical protein